MFGIGRDKPGLAYSRLCGTPDLSFMNDKRGERASLAGASKMRDKEKASHIMCRALG